MFLVIFLIKKKIVLSMLFVNRYEWNDLVDSF